MDHYEKAMNFAIPGNDDAILRWNTCARVIMQNPVIRPVPENEPAQAWERDEADSRIADASSPRMSLHRRGSATKPTPESQTLSVRVHHTPR
jgi:hypothetical protein